MPLNPNSKVQIHSHNIIHNKIIKFYVKDPRVIMELYQFSHSNKNKIKKGGTAYPKWS
jgi:very-short-patch-repair endonuclease